MNAHRPDPSLALGREPGTRDPAIEADLAAELQDLERLQGISTRLIDADGTEPLLDEIVEAAIAVTGADMGNIQLLEPSDGTLRLSVQRGFDKQFVEHFAVVDTSTGSCCGRALRERRRTVIDDVASDPTYSEAARQTMLAAGARAVQSTPLVTREGKPIGMLSTHWRRACRPSGRQMRLLDLLARQASDLLDRAQSAESLRATSARLALADQRKDAFLATLGHELRNPLAALDMAARLLATDQGDRRHIARVVESNVRQLTHLVNDMLEVSRITRGKVELHRQRVDVAEIARSAIEGVRDTLAAKAQHLTVVAPAPVFVDGDPTRVAQMVGNLLANATTYTADGGHVELEVRCDDDAAIVRVRDDGCGIEPDTLERMFEPFVQGRRGGGGLGIGLWLTRELAELHGGSLHGRSEGVGQGSEFEIRLPLAAESRTELPTAPERSRRRLDGLSVLVVDDHDDSADLLAILLRERGCTVHTACRGETAIDQFLATDYDVVLLDLGLPDVDGYEVAERMRDHDPDVPLVALTGFGDEDTGRRVTANGFAVRLVKPVEPDLLFEVMGQLCGARDS